MVSDFTDTWTIQTATYNVDTVQGTVSVGDWAKIPGSALQVRKLPMPGNTLLENLTANLSAKLT
jgi:hypothetical protein